MISQSKKDQELFRAAYAKPGSIVGDSHPNIYLNEPSKSTIYRIIDPLDV